MAQLRQDPHGRGVETDSPFPPVTHDDPVAAQGPVAVRDGAIWLS